MKDSKILEDAALMQEATEVAAILGAAVRTAKKHSTRMKKVAKS